MSLVFFENRNGLGYFLVMNVGNPTAPSSRIYWYALVYNLWPSFNFLWHARIYSVYMLRPKLRRQLRRGKLGGSSASQLPEYNPFLLHVAVHGPQRVKAKVLFPQIFSTMAEISPTTSLHLFWKWQRRQKQSLWFIISSESHIAFGRDIR